MASEEAAEEAEAEAEADLAATIFGNQIEGRWVGGLVRWGVGPQC